MSHRTMLRMTGLVLAVCLGVALGQLAAALKATNKAMVSTDATRALTIDEVAPSDRVIDEISRLSPVPKRLAPASFFLLVAGALHQAGAATFNLLRNTDPEVGRDTVSLTSYPLPPGILPSGHLTAS